MPNEVQAGYQLDKTPLVSTQMNMMPHKLRQTYKILLLHFGGFEGYCIHKTSCLIRFKWFPTIEGADSEFNIVVLYTYISKCPAIKGNKILLLYIQSITCDLHAHHIYGWELDKLDLEKMPSLCEGQVSTEHQPQTQPCAEHGWPRGHCENGGAGVAVILGTNMVSYMQRLVPSNQCYFWMVP